MSHLLGLSSLRVGAWCLELLLIKRFSVLRLPCGLRGFTGLAAFDTDVRESVPTLCHRHSLTFDACFYILCRTEMKSISLASLGSTGQKIVEALTADVEERHGNNLPDLVQKIKAASELQDCGVKSPNTLF